MIAWNPDLVVVEHDAESDRDAWAASRLLGVGGSDAAAVMGESPHKAPIDVWTERITGAISFVDNDRTDMGRILEPVVLDLFATGHPKWPREGGALTVCKPPSVYHRSRPWQRGSADGFVYYPEAIDGVLVDGVATRATLWSVLKPDALAEVKTHGWFGSRAYNLSDDGSPIVSVPPDKRIQCAWYMALFDVDTTYLACLIDTHLRRTFVIHRDRELEAMILEEVDQFWTRYVLTGTPPPPDGTDNYKRYLSQRFKTHTVELVMATPEVELAAENLLEIKRQQKGLEKNRDRLEQIIKSHIGDAMGVKTAVGKITWKEQPSGRLRDKEVRRALYEALGWTDDEISTFEEKYKQPDHRVLRTP